MITPLQPRCLGVLAVAVCLVLSGCGGEPEGEASAEVEAAEAETVLETPEPGSSDTSLRDYSPDGVETAAPLLRSVTAPDGRTLHFLRTATIEGVAENRKFQENIRFVRGEQEKWARMRSEYESSVDPEKRSRLRPQIEAAEKALSEYYAQLIKLYQLNIRRDFLVLPERAHLFVQERADDAPRTVQP